MTTRGVRYFQFSAAATSPKLRNLAADPRVPVGRYAQLAGRDSSRARSCGRVSRAPSTAGRLPYAIRLSGETRTVTDPALVVDILDPDDLEATWQALEADFGGVGHPDDRDLEHRVVDPSRFLVVKDRGEVLASAGSFPLEMTVPGGHLPVAGVTWVGVTATHRRRGLLTTMMRRLLTDRYEAGESVAALWASEAAIYQRFGYGPACWHVSVRAPWQAAFNREVRPGRLRLVEPDASRLASAYDAVTDRTPGWWRRDENWWAHRLHDPEHRRGGFSPLRCVVTDDGDGYALYATTAEWGPGGPAGKLVVRELAACTPDLAAQLWRFLLDVDLIRSVEARVALDDPLLHLLVEPRAAAGQLVDGLWVRPVEVGAALSSRVYAAPVDVVLDVQDQVCPWNTRRWRLSADTSGAVCTPTLDPAELTVGVADLGAALLGGSWLTARAAAGHLTELRPGALRAASTAFGPVGPSPSCPMTF